VRGVTEFVAHAIHMAAAPGLTSTPEPAGHPSPPSGSGRLSTLLGVLVAVAAVAAYFVFFVRSPAPPPAAVARLTAVEGNVRVQLVERGEWTQGRPSQGLKRGDVVQTDPRSGAEVTFFTGNVVRVRPDSVVLISAGEAEVAEDATAWHIQSGQVSFELKRSMDIVTATARTRATANSAGNVNVTEEGATGVKIFRGSAQVATTQGQTVDLAENQAVVVDRRGQAGAKIELPPTPRLIAPAARAELAYVTPPQATATLQWEAVRGAQTYHVAMDYNVHRAELLLSAALDQPGVPTTTHALSGLDAGSYFWRVAGVSKEGLEGDYSRVSLFSVIKPVVEPSPAAPPSLTVEASAVLEGVVLVKGQTDRGATVSIDGHDVRVLTDGSFSEFVRKTGQAAIVVRATGADGLATEREQAVAAY
jgi:hypothetical protein